MELEIIGGNRQLARFAGPYQKPKRFPTAISTIPFWKSKRDAYSE